MYKEVLRSIENVAVFPAISLGLFFAFFVILFVWTYFFRKETIDEMKNIPLN